MAGDTDPLVRSGGALRALLVCVRGSDQGHVGGRSLDRVAACPQGAGMSFVETPTGNTATAAVIPETKDALHGTASVREISIAHSPDSDDAFMFYALATNKVRVPGLRFTHTLCDIETLNQKAREGDGAYDVTAISFHAYPYIQDNYALLPSGGSVGEGYGPMIVASRAFSESDIKQKLIAVPGTLTTAYLALQIFAPGIQTEVVPFDQ